jgi:hypothetical protein
MSLLREQFTSRQGDDGFPVFDINREALTIAVNEIERATGSTLDVRIAMNRNGEEQIIIQGEPVSDSFVEGALWLIEQAKSNMAGQSRRFR